MSILLFDDSSGHWISGDRVLCSVLWAWWWLIIPRFLFSIEMARRFGYRGVGTVDVVALINSAD